MWPDGSATAHVRTVLVWDERVRRGWDDGLVLHFSFSPISHSSV